MITKNEKKKMKRYMQVKIFNPATWDNIYPDVFTKFV